MARWAKYTEIWSEKVPDLFNLGSNLTSDPLWSQTYHSWERSGMSALSSNWARFEPNGTCFELLKTKIDFQYRYIWDHHWKCTEIFIISKIPDLANNVPVWFHLGQTDTPERNAPFPYDNKFIGGRSGPGGNGREVQVWKFNSNTFPFL